MDRITGTAIADLGGGKRGFQDEILSTGSGSQEGTVVTANWLNAVQEEVLNVIEESGQVPDAGDLTQLSQAISVILSAGLDTKVNRAGDTMSGPLLMDGNGVRGVPDGINLTDAVNVGQLNRAGLHHGTQLYRNAGTYTFTAPLSCWYWVEVYGGGGGAANSLGSGEGGGGGGYAGKWVSLTEGQTVTVTVGALGITDGTGAGNGTAGGTSSFGSYCSATGGAGATYTGSPGAGGTGSGGNINLTGQSGEDGDASSFPLFGRGGTAAGPMGGHGAQVENSATWPGGGGSRGGVWNAHGAAGGVIIRY